MQNGCPAGSAAGDLQAMLPLADRHLLEREPATSSKIGRRGGGRRGLTRADAVPAGHSWLARWCRVPSAGGSSPGGVLKAEQLSIELRERAGVLAVKNHLAQSWCDRFSGVAYCNAGRQGRGSDPPEACGTTARRRSLITAATTTDRTNPEMASTTSLKRPWRNAARLS
jgi:hypothetical protein